MPLKYSSLGEFIQSFSSHEPWIETFSYWNDGIPTLNKTSNEITRIMEQIVKIEKYF